MSSINLNFINKSNDVNKSKVVLFQKSVNPDYNEDTIAWKVIEYCGQGDNHPFQYDETLQISAADAYGNFTPQMDASNGQLFEVTDSDSGHVLRYKGPGSNKNEVQVINTMSQGSATINCYRSGKLLASKTNVVPQETALFEFKPRIYIGILAEVSEGKSMNSALVTSLTELSLLGLVSADVAMRGGGAGRDSISYTFELENKVLA